MERLQINQPDENKQNMMIEALNKINAEKLQYFDQNYMEKHIKEVMI